MFTVHKGDILMAWISTLICLTAGVKILFMNEAFNIQGLLDYVCTRTGKIINQMIIVLRVFC